MGLAIVVIDGDFGNVTNMFLDSFQVRCLVLYRVLLGVKQRKLILVWMRMLNAENFHLYHKLNGVTVMPSGLWPGDAWIRFARCVS